jgi:hypothetical protein
MFHLEISMFFFSGIEILFYMSSIEENILTIVLYAMWINLSKVCLERALQQMGLAIVKLWLLNDVGQMPEYRSEISGT